MKDVGLHNRALKGALDTISPKNQGALRLGSDVSLATGRIHEVQGDSADIFAMIAASRLTGSVFWTGMDDSLSSLSPGGVQTFFDPARLTLLQGVSRLEVLWASEQALRTEGGVCVVTELRGGPNLKESRRLQIAAEESGALGLILISGRAQTSASETRWQCTSLMDNPMSWRWSCTKHRKGMTGAWRVNWREHGNGADTIHMAAATAA